MTSTTVPDACTLPTEDQPIRVAEFEALFANEVVSATRHAPTRLALQLRPGCAAAVRDLTERESQCCSFFTFTVRDEPDGVVLDIEVPGAYTGVLDGMEANIFGRRV